jgi:hypothetical protein
MIDFEAHKKKLEGALCVKNPDTDKNCIDKIDEKLWQDNVMPALKDISIKATDELQEETGKPYPKDSYVTFEDTEGNIIHVKSIDEFKRRTENVEPYDSILKDENSNIVGVRRNQKLLSMTLNLCYFLGFLDASGNHEMDEETGIGAKKRIEEAYKMGKESHPKSKSVHKRTD